MGTLCSSGKKNPIDQRQRKRMIEAEQAYHLLLLGIGECGKSTLKRQLELRYGDGLSRETRESLKPQILFNILDGIVEVIKDVGNRDEEFSDSAKEAAMLFIRTKQALKLDTHWLVEAGEVEQVKILFDDPVFQAAIKPPNRSHIQIADGWDEFINRLITEFPTWGGPDWTPSDTDIVRARVRTIGIQKVKFNINEQLYELTDVGGQSSERVKWLRFIKDGSFEGVIFVASVADYDLTTFENSGTNRLTDSILTFKKYMNIPEFERSALILFLNKTDLLAKKFCRDNISIKPEESLNLPPPPENNLNQSEKKNTESVVKWFADIYMDLLIPERRLSLFVFATSAWDSNKVEKMMIAIHANLLKNVMQESGVASF